MIKIGMLLPYEDMLLIAKRVYEATDDLHNITKKYSEIDKFELKWIVYQKNT